MSVFTLFSEIWQDFKAVQEKAQRAVARAKPAYAAAEEGSERKLSTHSYLDVAIASASARLKEVEEAERREAYRVLFGFYCLAVVIIAFTIIMMAVWNGSLAKGLFSDVVCTTGLAVLWAYLLGILLLSGADSRLLRRHLRSAYSARSWAPASDVPTRSRRK